MICVVICFFACLKLMFVRVYVFVNVRPCVLVYTFTQTRNTSRRLQENRQCL